MKGTLVQLLPEWHAEGGVIHLVFTTRRGQPPAVRALIDHLASRFAGRPADGAGSSSTKSTQQPATPT
jgi:DNA-binding transcriptional LysR family regulator